MAKSHLLLWLLLLSTLCGPGAGESSNLFPPPSHLRPVWRGIGAISTVY